MKHNKRERGQSLVELAISLVILLWLLSGAVEFGMAFFQFVQLRDAAQEGALYGSTHPFLDPNGNGVVDAGEDVTVVNQAVIEERARQSSPTNSPIDLSDSTLVIVEVISSDGSGLFCEDAGHGIQVTVRYNHHVFMPFMSKIIGPDIPLTATVTDTILTPMCPP